MAAIRPRRYPLSDGVITSGDQPSLSGDRVLEVVLLGGVPQAVTGGGRPAEPGMQSIIGHPFTGTLSLMLGLQNESASVPVI